MMKKNVTQVRTTFCDELKKEFEKIDNNILNHNYYDAGVHCGRLLERILKAIYGELRRKATAELLIKFAHAEEEIGGRGHYRNFSLEKLVRLLINKKFLWEVQSTLGVKAINSVRIRYDYLVDIRNKSSHDKDTEPTEDEIEIFKNKLMILAREFNGILSKKNTIIDIPPLISVKEKGLLAGSFLLLVFSLFVLAWPFLKTFLEG